MKSIAVLLTGSNRMKSYFACACCVLLLGCSNSDEAPTAEEAAAAEAAAQQAAIPENPQIKADVDSLNADISAKNYDSAFRKIAILEDIPKSPQQQEEYRQAVKHAADTLYQQGLSDPQAMERYRQLGRIRKGR